MGTVKTWQRGIPHGEAHRLQSRRQTPSMQWQVQSVNSLGGFVQEQMALLGWSRAALVERSGLADWEVDALTDDGVLGDWPAPHVVLALSQAFHVPVRDVVLHAARGCGLHVELDRSTVTAVSMASNEELLREVRRRLALGAATGSYLAAANHRSGADSGLQFS